MTDQTTPDVTNEERMLARKWAKSIESRTETWTACTRAAVRVILNAVPTPPTLADMTMEERAECQWMQADVEGYERRPVILLPNASGGRAVMLNRLGQMAYEDHGTVTPRPDLPRLTWPSDTEPDPAPALPEGWRLADHQDHGRGVVTTPTPNSDGRVCFAIPSRSPLGYNWHLCYPAELTYTDQEADQ